MSRRKDTAVRPTDALKQSAARLHTLGPLPLAHFLAEVASGRDLVETLSRYTALDPELVRRVGADTVDATSTAASTALAYVPPKGCA